MMQEEEATHLLSHEDVEQGVPHSEGGSTQGPEELDESMIEYLQSLAFEEDGGDGTGNWAGHVPAAGGNNDANNDNRGNNQNNNDWEDYLSPQVQRLAALKTWRRANLLVMSYLTPIIISLGIVTIVDWDSACETPLRIWALTQNILQAFVVTLSIIIVSRLPSYEAQDSVIEAGLKRLRLFYATQRILDVLWFAWFIAGIVWTVEASGKECPSTAPHLYKMCLALVVIQVLLVSLGLVLCCCACCGLCLRMVISPALAHMPPPAPRGASKRVIDQLPLKRYSEDLGIDPDHSSCAICLSEYEQDEGIRFLPCKHHFHATCIDTWLQTNKSCPFCKKCIDDPTLTRTSEEEV